MTTILSMDVHTVAVDAVTPYPGNARQGDIGAIATSLDAHGQYRPLVVQRSTSYVLCGNNTLAAARQLDWPEVAVQYVDVDDAQARKILLADNKTNDRASYDEQLLASLLADLDTLDGTGYTHDEHDDLMALLEETEPAPPLNPTPPPNTPGEHTPTPAHPNTPLTHGERLDNNTTWTTSLEQKHENYQTSHARQIVLTYHGHIYVWVVNTLADLAEQYGTTNNADTIAHLIAHAVETTPPTTTNPKAHQ